MTIAGPQSSVTSSHLPKEFSELVKTLLARSPLGGFDRAQGETSRLRAVCRRVSCIGCAVDPDLMDAGDRSGAVRCHVHFRW